MPLESSITLESQQNCQTEQKPIPCPLHLERGKRTRRSIITIGRRAEPVEVVRSLTTQAWDRRNAGMHSKSAVTGSARFAASACEEDHVFLQHRFCNMLLWV